ncbi:udp-galactopyranose mutase [Stylonychia lemnae]|uniref:Udp-galactopyranose mutase n=1 Tax=Stylonychia lemnae TaxID=5949 RepID=A0A078AU99_STYLE|nr:udp-galactopyranose mutase [Stylonychia lemnae]|eukprot:CDW85571.1 udp-galactopyranose mutase [Stylonychia lemnae]
MTYLPQILNNEDLVQMQNDLKQWEITSGKQFKADQQMTFDGGNKPYEQRAFQWHHDGWGKDLIKIMILISDVPENGQRMRYCAGTNQQKWNSNRSKLTQFVGSFVKDYKYVNTSGKAGDVYLFMPNAMHAGTRNNTQRRDVIIFDLLPELKRNYGMPGFHPEVVGTHFTDYQKLILRVNEKDAVMHLENHDEENQKFLKQANQLLDVDQEYNIKCFDAPTLLSLQSIDNQKNLEIEEVGRFNLAVPLTYPIFKGHCEISQADQFKKMFQDKIIIDISKHIEIFGNRQQEKIEIQKYFRKQIGIDLLRDFDLPVEVDHPNSDMIRDTALLNIRDNHFGIHYQILDIQLAELNLNQIASIDFNAISQNTQHLLNQQQVLLKAYESGSQDYRDLFCLFRLLGNIQEMLQRIPDYQTLRINLAYLYFGSTIIQGYLQEVETTSRSIFINYLATIIYHEFNPKISIIGGGPFSLSFGYNSLIQNQLTNWQIFESTNVFGGLAQSFKDQMGFTWDIGGHVVFETYESYTRMLDTLKLEYNQVKRKSKVWIKGQQIDYPIQMHLWQLDQDDQQHILNDLEGKESQLYSDMNPTNYYEWCLNHFGQELTEFFLRPYNEKIWGCKLEEMNTTWTGKRFPTMNLDEIKRSISDQKVQEWGQNACFRYPLEGGNGAVWSKLAEILPREQLLCNQKVVKIDPIKKQLFFENNTFTTYERLVSTMPLTHLLMILDVNDDYLKSIDVNEFKHTEAYIIGLGIEGQLQDQFKDMSWSYFPECKEPFYRVTWLSNYSDKVVPDPSKHFSLLLEINKKSIDTDNHELIFQKCISSCLELGLISENCNVISKFIKDINFSYPVPFLRRDQIVNNLLKYLENKYAIYSRGRFGDWKYENSNQDQIFMASKDLILEIDENIKII